MQKEFIFKMLERRGLSTQIIDKGMRGIVEYMRTIDDVLLVFVKECKVNIEIINIILSLMTDSRHLVILVYANLITSDAKQALSKLPKIHKFTFDEMGFDLISVVPKHSLAFKGGEESKPKEWHKYPTILSTDIVARYYAFKHGDTIQVEEDDGTVSFKKCI